MTLNTADILLKHVCPGVGVVIAFIMFMSPLKAVLEVNKRKSLGELNALPFIAMAANCFSWIIYGFYNQDFYIYIGNMPGLSFGMFYVLTCYKFSKEQAQDMLRNIFLGFCGVFFVAGLVSLAAKLDLNTVKTLWGAVCVAILAIYYTAPLSSLARVIAQRDSSSLHWPLCAMNIINGLLWFAYGMALKDYFVGLPNGIGAGFNVVCLVFCFIFPAKGRSRLEGDLNPAANWQVVRLQSLRNPETDRPQYTSSGFFDLAQFRWRSGSGPSFLQRLASSSKFGSRSQLLPEQLSGVVPLPSITEAAAAGGCSSSHGDSPADTGTPDCKVQNLDIHLGGKDSAAVVAAACDTEQGQVTCKDNSSINTGRH